MCYYFYLIFFILVDVFVLFTFISCYVPHNTGCPLGEVLLPLNTSSFRKLDDFLVGSASKKRRMILEDSFEEMVAADEDGDERVVIVLMLLLALLSEKDIEREDMMCGWFY